MVDDTHDIKLADRLTAETERMFCPKMPRRLSPRRIVAAQWRAQALRSARRSQGLAPPCDRSRAEGAPRRRACTRMRARAGGYGGESSRTPPATARKAKSGFPVTARTTREPPARAPARNRPHKVTPSLFTPLDDVAHFAIGALALTDNNPSCGKQHIHRGLEIGLPLAISLRPPREQFGRVV
jgi:hypothetical protein